jgi:PAS domain-containing protein
LLAHAPIAVFALDAEGRYRPCRARALDRIGIGQDEAVGDVIFERHAARPEITSAARAALAGTVDEQGRARIRIG